MSDAITSGKAVIELMRQGWELWHVSNDALPGRWELRRAREHKPVHWDAIESIRRRYLAIVNDIAEERQEGRYTWAYVPKQRALAGGMVL